MLIYKKTCEWCGNEFTAHKSNTRYCSKQCADHANKERLRAWSQEAVGNHEKGKAQNVDPNYVMTPALLASYLGVSRATAYNYLSSGYIKCLRRRSTGSTLRSRWRSWMGGFKAQYCGKRY